MDPRIKIIADDDVDAALVQALRALVFGAFDGAFSEADWDHTKGGWRVVAFDEQGAPVSHAAVVPRRIEVGGRPFAAGYVEAWRRRHPTAARGSAPR